MSKPVLRLLLSAAATAMLVTGCSKTSGTTMSPSSPSSPGDPSGTYRGTFRIDTVSTFRNTLANGTVTFNCTFNIAITGTLVIDVENKGGGQVYAHLTTTAQESETSRTCSFPLSARPTGGFAGYDFQGSAASLQLGRTDTGTSGRNALTSSESFAGSIGTGEIAGTFSKSFSGSGATATPGETHVEGYPLSSASVRLTRP